MELIGRLVHDGALVNAYDPAVKTLPPDVHKNVSLCETPLAAAQGADALVISTEWPAFRKVSAEELLTVMPDAIVIDPTRFLSNTLGSTSRIRYAAVGYLSR